MKEVAVVGVGALGSQHARIYAESENAKLVLVVDIDEEKARSVSERWRCRHETRFEDVLGKVEAVSLAVPTVEHARIACAFLEQGTDVLVEKPMAVDLREADSMIEARERGGAFLNVGHTERFNPAFLAARPHIKQPLFFETDRLSAFVPRSLDIDVVLDLMIHDLDLLGHLVDSPLAEIRAVGIPILSSRMDIANARLEFENGCVANITASRVSVERIRKMRLFQPHDYISIDFLSRDIEMFSLAGQGLARHVARREFTIADEEPLKKEIEAFLNHDPAGCSGVEGRRALGMAIQIKDMIAERQRVKGPLQSLRD